MCTVTLHAFLLLYYPGELYTWSSLPALKLILTSYLVFHSIYCTLCNVNIAPMPHCCSVLLPRGPGLPSSPTSPDAPHEPRHSLVGRPHHRLAKRICSEPPEVCRGPSGMAGLESC